MKVGDYVRTKNGNIRKIVGLKDTNYTDDPDYYVDKVLINIEQNKLEDTIYMEKWLFDEEIIKSSPNIIDLIEVGDYVNGRKVYQVGYNFQDDLVLKMSINNDGTANNYEDFIYEKDIKSIVTKEQFESMEYKL